VIKLEPNWFVQQNPAPNLEDKSSPSRANDDPVSLPSRMERIQISVIFSENTKLEGWAIIDDRSK